MHLAGRTPRTGGPPADRPVPPLTPSPHRGAPTDAPPGTAAERGSAVATLAVSTPAVRAPTRPTPPVPADRRGPRPALPAGRHAPAPARTAGPHLAPFARGPALLASLVVVVVQLLTSGGYGYHRDELYFRVLEPAWGYVDQPPLMPFLVRTLSDLSGDALWAVRVPSALAVGVAVLLGAALARELGGRRSAQTWAAWMLASAPATLVFGHLAATAAVDLVVWLGAVLCAVRALLRPDPRWWLAAGAVAGLGTWNKWLVAGLAVACLAGLVAVGPRRELRSPWLLGGVVLALALAAPNLAYQAGAGWPQLAMGDALGDARGDVVRPLTVPFLAVLAGPPLVPVWVAGWWALWRRPQWRPVRLLAVAFPVLVGLTVLSGAQLYYPFGLQAVLLVAGCVPLAGLMARTHDRWRAHLAVVVAANGVVAALVALPLVPADVLPRSPVPALSPGVADQLGWQRYAAQVGAVHGALDPAERADAVLVASTYGLAGALDRYGDRHGLPPVLSGHNHLGVAGPPAAGSAAPTGVVLVVGHQAGDVAALFTSCDVAAALDNGLGVVTVEQGTPVAVCRGALVGWDVLWEKLRHLA